MSWNIKTPGDYINGPLTVAGSATITGDLTVDTSTLKVDSTNDRVGIQQATPLHPIHVGTTDLILDSSKNLGLGVTPVAGAGVLQLSSGINFPTTQVANANANTLDDYEEGTFTPTIEGQSSAGIGVYSYQIGSYVKIGSLVTVQLYVVCTAHTGTGNLLIAGLPFTSSSITNLNSYASIGYIDGVTLTATCIPLAYLLNNNTRIQLVQTPTGGGTVTNVPMDASTTIGLTLTYRV